MHRASILEMARYSEIVWLNQTRRLIKPHNKSDQFRSTSLKRKAVHKSCTVVFCSASSLYFFQSIPPLILLLLLFQLLPSIFLLPLVVRLFLIAFFFLVLYLQLMPLALSVIFSPPPSPPSSNHLHLLFYSRCSLSASLTASLFLPNTVPNFATFSPFNRSRH